MERKEVAINDEDEEFPSDHRDLRKIHYFEGQPHDKLAVLGDISVRVVETYCLESTEWLHDNLIEFYLEYLRHIKHKENRDKIEIVGPTVSQCIKVSNCSQTTEDMIGPLSLKDKSVVLIPVNNAGQGNSEGTHWSLLVMVPPTGRFYHLDTLDMNKDSAKVLAIKLSNQLDINSPKFLNSIGMRQDNAVDCGLYVLKNADKAMEHFVRTTSADDFHQARKDDIENMRRIILCAIEQVSDEQRSNRECALSN